MGQQRDNVHEQAAAVGTAAERSGVHVSDRNDPSMRELMVGCRSAGIDPAALFTDARILVA